MDLRGIPVTHQFYIRVNLEECVRSANKWAQKQKKQGNGIVNLTCGREEKRPQSKICYKLLTGIQGKRKGNAKENGVCGQGKNAQEQFSGISAMGTVD